MASIETLLAQPDVVRLARSLAARPGRPLSLDEPSAGAAIAIVLRARPGDSDSINGTNAGDASNAAELLLIRRAEFDGDPWSGHIACPGGRMEPRDRDLEATAVRETWEETGIDLSVAGRILGALNDITPFTRRLPALVIRPFVAVVDTDIRISESSEVAEAFWVPLAALLEQTAWGRGSVAIRGMGDREVDVFRHGEHVVWGLTHRALRELVERMGER